MCSPMRTRIGPEASASDISDAAATAPGAVGKAKKNASPLRVHFDPLLRATRLPDHAPMLGERLRVPLGAELMKQAGRALHIGEEEGDGAAREIAAHHDIIRPERACSNRP